MTTKSNLILMLALLTSIFGFDNHTYGLAVRFFKLINANHLLIATCSTADNARYVFKLNEMGFQTNVLDVNHMELQLIGDKRFGILIEIHCKEAEDVIQLANHGKFFTSRIFWFMILNTHINQSALNELFVSTTPNMFNITQYFQLESENITQRARMEAINNELNRHLLKELENELVTDPRKPITRNALKRLTELEALPDSEVTLAVPSATGVGRDLYAIHRKTNHSPMEADAIASAEDDDYHGLGKLQVPTSVRRSNYHRAVLRASCGLLYYSYFNRSDELTALTLDVWAQMTFTHVKLIEEALNFRMLIKCFDDYGWPDNGVFNGLVGFMQRHHADITATGLLLRNDRMNVMDYVDGTFEFKLGLLFRQPNLASVTNIFVLPFSRSVWIALVSLLIVTYGIIWWQLRIESRILDKNTLSRGEIFSFLFGVVSQQGYYLGINTVAVRISMLVALISSLFLFTSYSATIVALLQSPAGFINTLEDFLNSPLGIGIEDLPYERKFLEEDDHAIISKILTKKIQPQGEKAYVNTSEGINRVRKGFYAFQCELSNGYKLISETYTARDKCGLKKLDMFPNRILGPGTTKKSPYKEILACKMRWLREVGLTHRTVSRWSHRKPICEASRSGFFSVGINDIKPLIMIFVYGHLLAIGLALIERMVHRRKQNKPVKLFTQRKKTPVWDYKN